MTKERGETGQYVETATLDAVLGVFEDVRGPIVTSADVADALGCSRDTARRKLAALHGEGRVDRRETAGRVVWWLPADETPDDPETRLKRLSNDLGEPIRVGERVYEDGDAHPIEAPDVASEGADDAKAALASEESTADVAGALDALDLDADRREALEAMYAYLAEHGSARKSDFTGEVYPEHPAGYSSPGGWWNRLGKDALASLPGVEKPAEGRPNWRFSEE